jgi:hypothetical protein
MVLHLGINRRSAVAYLQSMAERHAQKVRAHVEAAAKLYEDVAAELARADTGQEAMMSAAGREDLARTAQRIAGIEAQAVAELERALGLVSGRA